MTANTASRASPFRRCKASARPNRVVYVGTFAKILFPAMRLGFLVVPEPIRDTIVAALSVTGQFAPLLTQAALADFMNEGHFTRHLRRTRRLYAERRHYFLGAAERHLGEWLRFRATESGIQVVGIFRDDCDDAAIARAAGGQGINVSPLSMQYRHGGRRRGLLMGFAAVDANTTEKAMSRLRSVLQEAFGQARRTGANHQRIDGFGGVSPAAACATVTLAAVSQSIRLPKADMTKLSASAATRCSSPGSGPRRPSRSCRH